MYMDFKVRIPADHGGVSKKSIKSGVYIYYSFGRIYKPDKSKRPITGRRVQIIALADARALSTYDGSIVYCC